MYKVKHFDSSRPKNGKILVLKYDINSLLKKLYLLQALWFAGFCPPFKGADNVFYLISVKLLHNILSYFKLSTEIFLFQNKLQIVIFTQLSKFPCMCGVG
jgi:hypothetical protein